MKKAITLILIACSFYACSTKHPDIPSSSIASEETPSIFPDYVGVTIPSRIAPLNFIVDGADNCVARFTVPDGASYLFGQKNKVLIDEKEWSLMLEKAVNDKLTVELWTENDGKWTSYNPFDIFVSGDDIDQYVSYRQIPPGYIGYEEIRISQRDLFSWDESDIYNNQKVSRGDVGQCANCHSYQNYNPDNMLLHLRGMEGGTLIRYDGMTKKVDLKRANTISAGVYPSWHPSLPLIAFSNNKTKQAFHTASANRVEVFDLESDLILYNIKNDSVQIIAKDENEWETFPIWSPDGNYLYFCSAHFEYKNPDINQDTEARSRYKEIKYSLYRMPFNKESNTFGQRELVYDAASLGKSVTLPRVSPDGKSILVAEGQYGCFHVWHRDADIKMLSLEADSVKVNNLEALNSGFSDSYPTWSSNGRWIMIASRRDDGAYTRPYIAHIDENGVIEKPFEIPVKNPEWYRLNLNSYNRPEFMVGKANKL